MLTLEETKTKVGDAIRELSVSDHNALVNAVLETGVFPVIRPASDKSLLNRGILNRDTFYAIHNTDLDLFSSCAIVASTLPSVYSNPIPVLAALLVLLFRYRRKRAKLNATQGLILHSLQKAPNGLTVSAIIKKLKESFAAPTIRGLKINPSRVKTELRNLENARLENGTLTSFVYEDDGRWFTIDI